MRINQHYLSLGLIQLIKSNDYRYWYESCTGEVFSAISELSCEEMECGICGDSATYIGEFDTEDEAMKELDVMLNG